MDIVESHPGGRVLETVPCPPFSPLLSCELRAGASGGGGAAPLAFWLWQFGGGREMLPGENE